MRREADSGRILSADDIAHYHRIVIALNETIRLMRDVDEVIDAHGGWPGAFASEPVFEGSEGGHDPVHAVASPGAGGDAAKKSDKQPWQMTRGEFHNFRVSQGFADPTENSRIYWQEIEKARAQGRELQPRVLREYEQLFGPRQHH